MTTALQLFKAACDEATMKLRRELPSVEKVLNRLDFAQVQEMQHALAQQFVVLLRNAADGVDVSKPIPSMRERIQRIDQARDVTKRVKVE
jgi:hypothetical protein